MTLLDEPVLAEPIDETGPAGGGGPEPPAPAEASELRASFVVLAAALAALAAAWMAGGLFRGAAPRLVAMVGVVIGAGGMGLATRLARATAVQYLVVPVSAAVGAALVAPAATGGTANLPGLVRDALQAGGLLQPPVVFEPGWRFILVVLLASLVCASVGLALTLRRPRLAVGLPAVVVLAGALLQPEGSEVASSAVAGALLMAAMAVAFGADLQTAEGGGTRFEVRRLARGALLMTVLVAVVVALSRAGFLFPEPDSEPIVPPRRPPSPPPEPDRVLFTADGAGPWRVGVLDGYDGEAFLLPPLDPARFVEVGDDGRIPDTGPAPADAGTSRVVFRIADTRGGTLPGPSRPVAVRASKGVEYDPRTQVLRLPSGRPPEGFTYTVASPPPPDAKAMAGAPPAAEPIRREFTDAPPPPNEVVTLLAGAPTTNDFDRLQYVRQQLYSTVVAAGAGRPTEVTPARVGSFLQPGAEATPYEITASEVLLARWAGVPARLGFGFYGGEQQEGAAARQFRPKHGAAWLEAYFEGQGWVPLVGTPPKAKASLSDEEKRDDPAVSATQELALVVYVPVELETIELLYQRVRAWASIALPLLAVLALLAVGWPYGAKLTRRSRRKRWAASRGPAMRIWVAYAELRDRANDLNIGTIGHSPLEFTSCVAADEEHLELAWLVTRATWGDLRRDLEDEDALAGEEMARSVMRRFTTAQPMVNRIAGFVSRASLREPFDAAIPGAGRLGSLAREPQRAPVVRPSRTASRRARVVETLRRTVRPRRLAVGLVIVAVLLAPLAVPPPSPAEAEAPARLPDELPTGALGYEFVREDRLEESYMAPGEESLTTGGRVYSIRKGSVVAGAFQVAVLRPDVNGRDRAVQRQIESTLQSGAFATRHFGPVRLRTLRKADQVLWVWFPPDRNVFELFVLRADVADGAALVREAIRQQLELPLEPPR